VGACVLVSFIKVYICEYFADDMQFAIPESQGGVLQGYLGRYQLEGGGEAPQVSASSWGVGEVWKLRS
jgi:hypothetical protein